MGRRKNPTLVKDLKQTLLFKGSKKGDHHVAIEDLSEEELKALPRSAYSDDEWGELDEYENGDDIKEYIYENDPEVQEKVKELEEWLLGKYKAQVSEVDEHYLLQESEEYFYMLDGHRDPSELVDALRSYSEDEYNELRENFEHVDEDSFDQKLGEILQSSESYDWNTSRYSYYREGMFQYDIMLSLYFDRHEIEERTEDVPRDVVELAIKEFNENSDVHYEIDPGGFLDNQYEYSIDDIREEWMVVATPNTEHILGELNSEFEGYEPEEQEPSTPVEERVVYEVEHPQFKRFQVIELEPAELREEGCRLGICVGRRQFRYAEDIENEKIKIFSVRSPSGKSKFTIEAVLDSDGSVKSIKQIKGKSNRFPGFTPPPRSGDYETIPSKHKFKRGEWDMAYEVVNTLLDREEETGIPGVDVWARDLQPGAHVVLGMPLTRWIKNPAVHCGFCNREK